MSRSRAARLRSPLALLAGFGLLALGLLGMQARQPASAAAGPLVAVSSFGNNPGALAMYSYTPANLPANAPLVVALHGCTQTANDYFSHSGWPELADQYGFAVVFPQQPTSNNSLQCFDWWTPSDDGRDVGEAASVKSMVDYEKAHLSIDPARVFVTGLSAGGAMTPTTRTCSPVAPPTQGCRRSVPPARPRPRTASRTTRTSVRRSGPPRSPARIPGTPGAIRGWRSGRAPPTTPSTR
jgi:poly(3-hydroxybutyrate) depolymerase